jgi:hypothetical protein
MYLLAVWKPNDGNRISDEPSRHVQASRPPSGKARLTAASASGVAGASKSISVSSWADERVDRSMAIRLSRADD